MPFPRPVAGRYLCILNAVDRAPFLLVIKKSMTNLNVELLLQKQFTHPDGRPCSARANRPKVGIIIIVSQHNR